MRPRRAWSRMASAVLIAASIAPVGAHALQVPPETAQDGAVGRQPVALIGQRNPRFPVPHLGLQPGHFAGRDIGRVGHDQVELLRRYPGKQVRLIQLERIRKLVEAEDPERPLSDSKIMRLLQQEGVLLARRTVAKYREELMIPSSDKRKKVF